MGKVEPYSEEDLLNLAHQAVKSFKWLKDWKDYISLAFMMGKRQVERCRQRNVKPNRNMIWKAMRATCIHQLHREGFKYMCPVKMIPLSSIKSEFHDEGQNWTPIDPTPTALQVMEGDEAFDGLIKDLDERSQYIMEQRYRYGKTLEDIAYFLKVSKERVRQLEQEALQLLRDKLEGRGLHG